MERIRIWVNTTDFPSPFKCYILFFDGLSKNYDTVIWFSMNAEEI